MSAAVEPAVSDYAGRIRPCLYRAAESLLEVGDLLLEAKAALPHGTFGSLLDELGMAPRVAQRFMAVARNPVLRNATHRSHLPPSLSALYELSRLSDDDLSGALDEGLVTPATTREAAQALRPPSDAVRREALETRIDSEIYRMHAALLDAPGLVRLRLVDELLRGNPEVDAGDETIRLTLLSIAIEVLDGAPAAAESDDPVGQLSAVIAWVLPHLWQGDPHAIVEALAVLAIAAAAVPVGVRPSVLLQALDGHRIDEVHPTTRLVVDALGAASDSASETGSGSAPASGPGPHGGQA